MLSRDRLVLVSRKGLDTFAGKGGQPSHTGEGCLCRLTRAQRGGSSVGLAWSQKHEGRSVTETRRFSSAVESNLLLQLYGSGLGKRIFHLEIRPLHSGKSSDVSDG